MSPLLNFGNSQTNAIIIDDDVVDDIKDDFDIESALVLYYIFYFILFKISQRASKRRRIEKYKSLLIENNTSVDTKIPDKRKYDYFYI